MSRYHIQAAGVPPNSGIRVWNVEVHRGHTQFHTSRSHQLKGLFRIHVPMACTSWQQGRIQFLAQGGPFFRRGWQEVLPLLGSSHGSRQQYRKSKHLTRSRAHKRSPIARRRAASLANTPAPGRRLLSGGARRRETISLGPQSQLHPSSISSKDACLSLFFQEKQAEINKLRFNRKMRIPNRSHLPSASP